MVENDKKILIGNRIKKRRKELGLTQLELAVRCGYKDNTTISNIEKGRTEAPLSRLKTIANALGVSVDYFTSEMTLEDTKDFARIVLQLRSEQDHMFLQQYVRLSTNQKKILMAYMELLLKKE